MKLADRLAQLEDPYLLCRTRRHVYDECEDDGRRLRKYQAGKSIARMTQLCVRCTTVHYEAWNQYTGDILGTAYIYPPDYRIIGGAKKKNVRKELLDRRRKAKPGTFGKL